MQVVPWTAANGFYYYDLTESYVVVQLVQVAYRMGYKELLMWGLLVGLLAGFATDMILTAAGV